MRVVTLFEYDDGNLVNENGLLTKVTGRIADNQTSLDRVLRFVYDFRDRRTQVITDDGTFTVYEVSTYDNLDRVTKVEGHNGSATGTLLSRYETKYDNRGKVFQTIRYAVDTGGTAGNTLVANFWYDAGGNIVKNKPPGSDAYTKTEYDAISRATGQYQGFAANASEDPFTVGNNDRIFKQTTFDYDAASEVIKTTRYRRNATADPTTNGKLTTSNARITYDAAWFDAIGRQIASANWGTNGGTPPTRPDTPPASSTSVLVARTAFNDRGEPFERTDPKSKVTRTTWDDAGREIKIEDNYISGGSGTDVNVTVETAYNSNGNVATLTARNSCTPPGSDQTTTYVYGVSLPADGLTGIASNHLLAQALYPDSTGSSTDRVSYTYNRQGDQITMTDQNQNVHTYTYDELGRRTSDDAAPPSGTPDVRKIEIGLDIHGRVNLVTSWNNSGGVANQVKLLYNDFGQLASDQQAHSGAADSAPTVSYGYAAGSTDMGQTNNTIRLTSITYPTVRTTPTLSFDYTAANDSSLSRPSSLTFAGTRIVDYTVTTGTIYSYLGLDRIVKLNYPQPNVTWNLTDDAGNYPGWDAFDRIIVLPWTKVGGSPPELVKFRHDYDLASNMKYRRDDKNADYSELYMYDGDERLSDLERGVLNTPGTLISPIYFDQHWHLDPTGNWKEFWEDVFTTPTSQLRQTRDHNKANEITLIGATTGPVWNTPTHDANGNMTNFVKPDNPAASAYLIGTYDAWNRLVKLVDSGTSATVATFTYDGLGRRITKTVGSTTRHYYYDSAGRVIEERVGTATTGERQFLFGLRGTDDLILRDRSTGTGLDDERRYALQDAMWSVAAVSDTNGTVQERYVYDGYGRSTRLSDTYGTPLASVDWETQFTALRKDLETDTGLYSLGDRHYHPSLGRFISRSRVGYVGGMNLMAAIPAFSRGAIVAVVAPIIVPIGAVVPGIGAPGVPGGPGNVGPGGGPVGGPGGIGGGAPGGGGGPGVGGVGGGGGGRRRRRGNCVTIPEKDVTIIVDEPPRLVPGKMAKRFFMLHLTNYDVFIEAKSWLHNYRLGIMLFSYSGAGTAWKCDCRPNPAALLGIECFARLLFAPWAWQVTSLGPGVPFAAGAPGAAPGGTAHAESFAQWPGGVQNPPDRVNTSADASATIEDVDTIHVKWDAVSNGFSNSDPQLRQNQNQWANSRLQKDDRFICVLASLLALTKPM